MPLDHYVSQVHLKNFYSPALDNLMYAIRKSDLKTFRCNSQSVCRIEDGSTNAHLIDDRAVEDFLLGVEPKYNASVTKLRDDKIDNECIYAIAGFVAYVASCSPAAMRIHAGPLKGTVESVAAVLDKQGLLGKSPPSLGEKSLSELLTDGTVRITVDPKYPQAMGISNITRNTSVFGNAQWEILFNDYADSPFFTSDFPVAIEATDDPRVLSKLIPLAPNLAVRITPKIEMSRADHDFTFAKFSQKRRSLTWQELLEINRLLVQCAEDTIFYRDNHKWIQPFVAKHRYHRIEPIVQKLPYGTGIATISTQRIVSRLPDSAQVGA
jgi:hypothetical protein